MHGAYWGKTLIPATDAATTKGEAAALVDFLFAASKRGSFEGTINPMTKTDPT